MVADAALDFQEALFDALSQGGTTHQKHQRAADTNLNKLRLYLRLSITNEPASARFRECLQQNGEMLAKRVGVLVNWKLRFAKHQIKLYTSGITPRKVHHSSSDI